MKLKIKVIGYIDQKPGGSLAKTFIKWKANDELGQA